MVNCPNYVGIIVHYTFIKERHDIVRKSFTSILHTQYVTRPCLILSVDFALTHYDESFYIHAVLMMLFINYGPWIEN